MTSRREFTAGEMLRRDQRRTLEMFVKYLDGTGKTLQAVEDTPENRRTLDRMAWHIQGERDDIDRIDVDVIEGRTAGYERSK